MTGGNGAWKWSVEMEGGNGGWKWRVEMASENGELLKEDKNEWLRL
jgi:hypothetical protein